MKILAFLFLSFFITSCMRIDANDGPIEEFVEEWIYDISNIDLDLTSEDE